MKALLPLYWLLHIIGTLAIWITTFPLVIHYWLTNHPLMEEYYQFSPKLHKLDNWTIGLGGILISPFVLAALFNLFLLRIQ